MPARSAPVDIASLPPGLISHTVFQTMASTDAVLERFAPLGDNLVLAVWRRDTPVAETSYNQPGHHTLSYYMGGGYRTDLTNADVIGRFLDGALIGHLTDDGSNRAAAQRIFHRPQHIDRLWHCEHDKTIERQTIQFEAGAVERAQFGLHEIRLDPEHMALLVLSGERRQRERQAGRRAAVNR